MKRKALTYIVLCFSFAAALFSGCGSRDGGDIRIGALFNLTGGQSSLDYPSYNGFLLAASEINEAGGINGRKIEVVNIDGRTDEGACAEAASELIDKGCVVVAGLSDSNYALAAAKVCQEREVPFITSGATLQTIPEQVGDYAFLAPFGDDIQAFACADYAYYELGYKKCYLLTDDSMEFTRTLSEFFEQRFVENGGEIVSRDFYSNGDTDFSGQIKGFMSQAGGRAQFIFAAGVPDDAGNVVKQFRDAGYTGDILSGDGFDTPLIYETAGEQSYGVIVGTHVSLVNPAEKVQNFVREYTKRYGAYPENAFAALGYDCMYLIADALSRAEKPDNAPSLRDAIAGTQGLEVVTGTITYIDGSRVPNKSVTINEIIDGVFEFRKEITP